MNKEDKRGIFFGVVGVLTLIVAIIGASLAYFSINAQSDTDALTVQAASVQIVYDDGDKVEFKNMIPSSKEVATRAFFRYANGEKYTPETGGEVAYKECIDDNNNVVCGVYEFSLTNNGVNPAEITARIVPTTPLEGATKFENLMYTLYDITDVPVNETTGERNAAGTPVEIESGVTDGKIKYTEFSILPSGITINGGGVASQKVYRLFVWLNEEGPNNNKEQGAEFKGTIYIDVKGSQNITGTINE